MTQRGLRIGLIASIAFVVVAVWFFAHWPSGFLGIKRPESPGDFGQLFSAAQSIFAGLGLIGVVYTILRQHLDLQEQRKTTAVSLELATSAALFTYYNEKIASLRNAIRRDAAHSKHKDVSTLLAIGGLDENVRTLQELLGKHSNLRDRMEALNREMAPPRVR